MQQPWKVIPATGPLLRPAEAAQYLGYKSRSHYYELAKRGVVPEPLRFGQGTTSVGVPKPWLDAIIAAAAA